MTGLYEAMFMGEEDRIEKTGKGKRLRGVKG